jgi:hypothetical protein
LIQIVLRRDVQLIRRVIMAAMGVGPRRSCRSPTHEREDCGEGDGRAVEGDEPDGEDLVDCEVE